MSKVALVAHWDWVLFNFRLPIARGLQEAGHDVVLICPEGDYAPRMRDQGFRVIPWEVDRRSFQPLQERRAVARLTRIYATEDPDVAHHFTIKPNLYGTLAARRSRVKVIINTFSGMGFLLSEGFRARFLRLAVTPLMRVVFGSRSVWTVFQNREDLELAVARRWVAAERSSVIAGSGVDVDLYAPHEPRRREGPPVFVMAARLIKEKGVGEFVAAARAVAEKGIPARFVIAGEPDDGNPSSLKTSEIDAWRRSSPVEFVGQVSDMVTLLAEADVAVLPTYYPEGLPRFLLEAAAAGLPLIATDIAPCRPVVREGSTGYLVPPRDPTALAAAMTRLATDAGSRRKLGANARRLVVENFREQDVVNQYLTLYEQLLAGAS